MRTVYFELMNKGGRPQPPTKAYEGDAGWDLYTSQDITFPSNSFTNVPTEIAVALPAGIWGHLLGRSSTIRRYNLRVEPAVIDNGYRGELFIGVWNHNMEPITLEAGSRIAQLVLAEIVPVQWNEVKRLPVSERGWAGLGSSGR